LFIYFRVCEKQQTISNVVRFQNITKTNLLRKCWLSLQNSINNTDTLIVIHDSVSEDTLIWLENTSKSNNIEFIEVPEHSWEYHQHTVTMIETLEKYASVYPNELHYIVEDDYIHVPNAIRVMEASLKDWAYFAVSYDYPDRYTLAPRDCRIILGPDRHWRTIDSCTMTTLAKGSRWLDHMNELKLAAPTSNDKVFEDIFKTVPCVSPLPSLSSHMTDYHMSPYINWEQIWNSLDE
jgi:hypothetical protein